jgi:hypothetical protein
VEYRTKYIQADDLEDVMAEMIQNGFEPITLMPAQYVAMRAEERTGSQGGAEPSVATIFEVIQVYAIFGRVAR